MEWNNLSIPKLQRCNRWSLGMDKYFHLMLYWSCDYLSMLGLNSIHLGKMGPRYITPPRYHWYVCMLKAFNMSGERSSGVSWIIDGYDGGRKYESCALPSYRNMNCMLCNHTLAYCYISYSCIITLNSVRLLIWIPGKSVMIWTDIMYGGCR